MNKEEFKLVATCFFGFEEVLSEELKNIGVKNIQIENRAVSFEGTKKQMYECNYKLRTAIKVLKPIYVFKAENENELYDGVKKVDWTKLFTIKDTFKVSSVVNSDRFTHSQFVALKTKDAIVDQFKEKEDRRPFIDKDTPNFKINIRINGNMCTVSLDSSGESLFKRGYRITTQDAPINEVVAAGLIQLSGWKKDCNFIDPMCGSGTFLVEAAMYAYNIPAGVFRESFGFERWPDYEEELFDDVMDEAVQCDFDYEIMGFDKSIGAITSARHNVTRAFLENKITLRVEDFFEVDLPTDRGFIITNPPYGERLDRRENIPQLYKSIGDTLKNRCLDYTAWIISGNIPAMKFVGLRPSKKIRLFNGALDCQFNKYEIYSGSKKIDKFEDSRFNGYQSEDSKVDVLKSEETKSEEEGTKIDVLKSEETKSEEEGTKIEVLKSEETKSEEEETKIDVLKSEETKSEEEETKIDVLKSEETKSEEEGTKIEVLKSEETKSEEEETKVDVLKSEETKD